jgi:hypothetical protein
MMTKVEASLIEQRRKKQVAWWASLTDAERAAHLAKQRAGIARVAAGRRRLAEREIAE